jgi:hypothetical protein
MSKNREKPVDGEPNAGNHRVNFNTGKLSSGIYYYRIKAGGFVQEKHMQLIK